MIENKNLKKFEIKADSFYLDGKKFNIYSGAIHYFRVLPEYWEDRLMKLKLAGFNTVETYVSWNFHEPKKGEYNFEGRFDLIRFIETAKKVGLYVIVRPGPYICAEWDFGGFPAWLLKDKNMKFRCYYEPYLKHVSDWYKKLLPMLVDYQCTRKDGNILMMQVENEYGSYGSDKKYLNFIKDLMIECGIDVPLFTSDGELGCMLNGGTIDGVFKTLNFGSRAATIFKHLDRFKNNGPKMCSEFWCGWFDHWGDKHHTRASKGVKNEIQAFLDQDASFNFYMFHGGTNFGFSAGSNFHDKFYPTTTSYDYFAPLNEYGDYTPTYHVIRELLCKHQNIEMKPLPNTTKLQNVGEVELTEYSSLWDNLDVLGEKHYSPIPDFMESFDQNFGLIYYKTMVDGPYDADTLTLRDVHDRAYVYYDGELQKIIYRNDKKTLWQTITKKQDPNSLPFPEVKDKMELGILIEAMGRVNYGHELVDRKGFSMAHTTYQHFMNFEITTLPLDNIEKVNFDNKTYKYPLFFRGKFKAKKGYDCFVNMEGFKKGIVYVNGFNLGRYWEMGPQKTLYLPGVLLKDENEIVVLELESNKKKTIVIQDKPILG